CCVSRAGSGNRARVRHQPLGNLSVVRTGRLSTLREALPRESAQTARALRTGDGRQHRIGAGHLRSAAIELLHDLAQGTPRRAYGESAGTGRHAADGRQQRGDGRPAAHFERAGRLVRAGRYRGGYSATHRCAELQRSEEGCRRLEENTNMSAVSQPASRENRPPVLFDRHPDRYVHWHLTFDGPVATLAMDVDEEGGLMPGYRLKLNSYDLGVDIELNDALQRIRFEHPEVKCVLLTSAKERMFCSGANIYMLGQSSHAWKVN